jgi:hypothetical protein
LGLLIRASGAARGTKASSARISASMAFSRKRSASQMDRRETEAEVPVPRRMKCTRSGTSNSAARCCFLWLA